MGLRTGLDVVAKVHMMKSVEIYEISLVQHNLHSYG
jgi:hypothetical protein